MDYKILDANPAFEQIIGIRKQDAIGAKASELYQTGEAPYLETFARVAETGKPITFEATFEPMGKSFKISVFSPKKSTFATLFLDITEQKKAEEENRKLSEMVKNSSELVNLGTLDGMMTFINEAGGKMLGIDPKEVDKVNIMQVIPDHLKEFVEKEVVATILKGESWEGELQYQNL